MPGYSVWLRAWQVQVGRVKLYLLDSNTELLFGVPPKVLLDEGGRKTVKTSGYRRAQCHAELLSGMRSTDFSYGSPLCRQMVFRERRMAVREHPAGAHNFDQTRLNQFIQQASAFTRVAQWDGPSFQDVSEEHAMFRVHDQSPSLT